MHRTVSHPCFWKSSIPGGESTPGWGGKVPGQPSSPPLAPSSLSWSNNTIVTYHRGHRAAASADRNKPGYCQLRFRCSGWLFSLTSSTISLFCFSPFLFPTRTFSPHIPLLPVSLSWRESLRHLEKQDSCVSVGIVVITGLISGGGIGRVL